jgi:7-cyano-7-deazaguanine synthase
MPKALVILSGGQDSTTCLFWALKNYNEVCCLTFDYGQRHRVEIESARKVAGIAKVDHEILNMAGIFTGSSPLTDLSATVARYESAEELPGGLEDTFVPGRNILFLTIAASRAYVAGADDIVIGVSQEDFGGYPDCREDFIKKMEAALASGLDKPLKIIAPLQHLNKKETVELAAKLPGCLQALAYTTTCYNGEFPPCGECHACLLRARGFEQAGIEDPARIRAMGAETPGARRRRSSPRPQGDRPVLKLVQPDEE